MWFLLLCPFPHPLPLSGFALFVFLLIWLFFHVVFCQTACFFPFLSPATTVTDMEEGSQPGAACPLPVPFPPPSASQHCPWGRAGANTRLQTPMTALWYGGQLPCLHPELCPGCWRDFDVFSFLCRPHPCLNPGLSASSGRRQSEGGSASQSAALGHLQCPQAEG